jgi:hypothetical protein
MTHNFLAMMFCVRWSGVTIAAQSPQAGGLTTDNHGSLTILDREALGKV